ncbi:MBL fold metallo-hydrolase [Gemmobacter sp. LW-1]|uniref:MBL fold metallo-hydrolase n=1 Tax=Gemmobacter sp. LW-1 TaxID=1529005 RepID=UPI0006C759C4|nr:MBL fold metallo-hydrolase [Gemmobacter sp. LW-1]
MISRRSLMTLAAAAVTAPLAPRRLWAGNTLTLGGMQIDTLSDGFLTLPGSFLLDGAPPEATDILTRYGISTDQMTPPCNVTLLRDADRVVLFDVGAGHDFMPSAGKLAEAFDTLGITPEDITHVLFTHGHPDHLWGLLDEFDDPIFPNAEFVMGQAEFDYWTDPETVNTIGAARTTFAVGAARRLGVIADQIRLIADGDEVLPGIAAHLTPGHTPGHIAYELRAGSEGVLIAGDAIGNHHIAFERPDWHSGSDQDAETAAATRLRLLDRLASEQMPLIGFHLPGGGIGRAERADGTYRFVES